MTDDLQLLTSAYLNGDLADEEAEVLRRLLESNAEARAEFVRALDLHAELRKVFLERKGNTEAIREFRHARKVRTRLLLGAFAASAVVAAAFLFAALRPGAPEPVLLLESLAGRARLLAGAERIEVGPGRGILSGQGLETLEGGRASLKYPDGSTLHLGPRTRVQEFAQGGGKRVVLSVGTVTADVCRQPADRPMTFATPHGEAKVLGTSLKLAVDPDPEKGSTRLEVTNGRVRLSRRKGGESVDVAAHQFAVVAHGVALEAKPLSEPRSAELIRRMPPNSWLSLPETRLRQVAPDPARFPKIKGIDNPTGIVDSWSGAVLDTHRNRLIVWGGGHTNYHGNEVYAFDLVSLRWERLTDPAPDPVVGRQVHADGTPIARATYNGLAYIAHADRMFALGGDPADTARVTPDFTWTFDFSTIRWENRNPAGDRPLSWVGCHASYDPATRKVWWGEGRSPGQAGLYSYDFDGNRWTKHTGDHFYYQTSTVDVRRGTLVCVGDGKLFAYDVRGGTPVRQNWATTGGGGFVAKNNPGFDYDPGSDRLVGWSGGAVQVLHPETKAWKAYDAPGAPKPTVNGIFGRWRYVPALKVFVLVTSIDENVHFYRLPAGG